MTVDPKVGIENLVIARDVLTELGVRHFLSDGTLLGLVREGKFIDHDEDLDMGLLAEDLSLSNFSRWVYLMMEKGFVPTTYGEWGKPTFIVAWWRKGLKLDVAFWFLEGERRVSIVDSVIEYWFPSGLVESLSSVEFLGEIFTVPKDSEAMLARQYGDWKTPKVDWELTSPLNSTIKTTAADSSLKLKYLVAPARKIFAVIQDTSIGNTLRTAIRARRESAIRLDNFVAARDVLVRPELGYADGPALASAKNKKFIGGHKEKSRINLPAKDLSLETFGQCVAGMVGEGFSLAARGKWGDQFIAEWKRKGLTTLEFEFDF